MTSPKPRLTPRGTTLLEALIALSVLLIGLLGMAQFQIWSLGSNQAARVQTQALTVARELAAGLERLQYDDPLLTASHVGTSPPAGFGKVLQPDGSVDTSGFTAWDDAFVAAVPNVRLDATIDRDQVDTALPAFQRRWTVWAPSGMSSSFVRVVAVSVLYRERTFQRPQEVTVLAQISNAGAAMANIAASR